MKDQNPEPERQVATEQQPRQDQSPQREPQQPYQQRDAQQQSYQPETQQNQQQPQQSRQEFERAEQGQPVDTMSQQANGGLIGGQEMNRFAAQWTTIQAAFVDEPKKAVEQADQLVVQVIQHLSTTFTNERQKLEAQWSRGDSASTEDLRVALQRYRQFFQSLLKT